MKKLLFLLLTAIGLNLSAAFDDYFISKTLRIDYYHTGDHLSDAYSMDQMIQEPIWGGSKVNLIDIFDYGKYNFLVYDAATNTLIYSRTLPEKQDTRGMANTQPQRHFREEIRISYRSCQLFH
jgi:hypothetical protein